MLFFIFKYGIFDPIKTDDSVNVLFYTKFTLNYHCVSHKTNRIFLLSDKRRRKTRICP
ncbi:predicted protein [Neisseria gonorrhoeae PID18]|nr:predicted protein [Neisseria gonorrhoeae PID18]